VIKAFLMMVSISVEDVLIHFLTTQIAKQETGLSKSLMSVARDYHTKCQQTYSRIHMSISKYKLSNNPMDHLTGLKDIDSKKRVAP
jgi:hypothetical protein